MKMVFLFLFFALCFSEPVFGAAQSEEEKMVEDLDFSGTKGIEDSTGVDFKALVKQIVGGDVTPPQGLFDALKHTLTWQMTANRKGFINILILALLSGIFTNFASAFQNGQIGETGLFVSLLSIMALLFSVFYLSGNIASEAIGLCITFMKSVIPLLSAVMAASSGSLTTLACHELILGLIMLIYWIFQGVVLKIAGLYAAFSMVNSLSREKNISRLCKLFQMAGSWIIKTVLGVVIGIGTVQAMVVPMSDSIKTNLLNKALSAIPGIGNGVSAVSSTLMGASSLIKNSVGAAAFIILVCICLVPVVKLAIFVVMYRILAAVLEPVCDQRITTCIHDVSEAMKMQMSAVIASAGLFMIAIAILCMATNVNYYAG